MTTYKNIYIVILNNYNKNETMKDKNKCQAFPSIGNPHTDNYIEGMTLRDYFAAKAMQYVLSTEDFDWKKSEQEHIAIVSYAMADAMLKEREK